MKGKKLLVSIVTPTLNNEKDIVLFLNSINMQTTGIKKQSHRILRIALRVNISKREEGIINI